MLACERPVINESTDGGPRVPMCRAARGGADQGLPAAAGPAEAGGPRLPRLQDAGGAGGARGSCREGGAFRGRGREE
jgi:hypothetical protein